MTASAPTRSAGSGVINFGLVTVPVRLYNGIDSEAGKIKREMRSPAGNPIQFRKIDAATKEEVAHSDIRMVYVTEDSKEVELSDEEMDAAAGNAENWNLVGFYPLREASNFTFETLVQVRPDVIKKGKNTERPYDAAFSLLMLAMDDREVFALLEYTSRGSRKVGVLTSDGNMRLAFHADEVREPLPLPAPTEVTEEALVLAGNLVDSMTKTGAQVPENTSAQKIRAYAETKAEGTVASEVRETAKVGTVDLVAALSASITNAKKSQLVKAS